MKTKFMVIIILSLQLGIIANAQEKRKAFRHPQFTAEKIDSIRCNCMVNELMLNDATTAKFTPVYMNYLSDIRKLNSLERRIKNTPKKIKKEITDADAQKITEDRFSKAQKLLDIRIKYYKEFKQILNPKQIMHIYQPHKFQRYQNMRAIHLNNKVRNMKIPSMFKTNKRKILKKDSIDNLRPNN